MQKRRAPRACLQCRQRKIKCDFSSTGIPCSNCTRLGAACSVNPARKSRKASAQDEQGLPLANFHTFEVQPIEATIINNEVEVPDASAPLERQVTAPKSTVSSESTDPPLLEPLTVSSTLLSSPSSVVLPIPDPQLPPYITPFRGALEPEVLYLLYRRGAVSLPQRDFRENLLRAYVCYVHPFLPLLDLEGFISTIENEDGSRTVSLILFQAVMFAGSTFVDVNVLEKEGFKSHKDARETFFNKVRALYDADLETDSLTLIQVLVLMTYWYDKPEDPKHRSHWMRIALSFATDVGLIHTSALADLPPPQQRLRRRLWWCCLMRDKLISFSERQPSSIPWDETAFPVLSVDDLDNGALSKALERYHVPDHDKQSNILTELCFQKIRLCVLIGRVLHTQYELSSHQRRTSSGSQLLLIPKFSGSARAEYMYRDQEFREWGSDICSTLHLKIDRDPQRNGTLVRVHSAVLEILSYNVLGMVHRPQVLNNHPTDSAARALQDFSEQTLRTSAHRISEIANFLNGPDLLRFIPPIGLTGLLFAAMQHVKDSQSASSSVRDTANQDLDWTVQAMSRLKEMYPQAHHAVSFLEHVRTKRLHVEDESPAIGQKRFFSFFRNEVVYYDPLLQQVEMDHMTNNAQEGHTSRLGHQNFYASKEPAAITSSQAGIDYSQRKGFDFESFLNLDEVSEIFLSGNFDVADFERVDWAENLQERSWDV